MAAARSPHRWAIVAVRQPDRTASMAHPCCLRSINVPSLRSAAARQPHRWDIIATGPALRAFCPAGTGQRTPRRRDHQSPQAQRPPCPDRMPDRARRLRHPAAGMGLQSRPRQRPSPPGNLINQLASPATNAIFVANEKTTGHQPCRAGLSRGPVRVRRLPHGVKHGLHGVADLLLGGDVVRVRGLHYGDRRGCRGRPQVLHRRQQRGAGGR